METISVIQGRLAINIASSMGSSCKHLEVLDLGRGTGVKEPKKKKKEKARKKKKKKKQKQTVISPGMEQGTRKKHGRKLLLEALICATPTRTFPYVTVNGHSS